MPQGPQRSHIGPLAFIMFINGVAKILRFAQLLMYADDAKIYMKVNSINDCHNMQLDINEFDSWCSKMGLLLNIEKCKVMTFTRKQNPIE